MQKLKRRIFEIIQAAEDNDISSKIFDLFILCLILFNVCLLIATTFNISENTKSVFSIIETISVIIFTIEYFLRVWTADYLYPDKSPTRARIRYIFSFMAFVDLISILPFYLPFVLPIDLKVLRMLRLLRVFHLLKVNRYTSALSTIGGVLKQKSNQLVSSLIVVFILMVISSLLMYNVENPVQPDVFKNAFSGLWWSIATFTTVGYGDIYPITGWGRLFSSIIALLGIGLVAVPTGIISAGFIEEMEQEKNKNISINTLDKSNALRSLKDLLDDNIITAEEFLKEKQKILK